MKTKTALGRILIAVGLGISVASLPGLTASNVVPVSNVGSFIAGIGAEELKPADCAAITLTAIVTGSGIINGTNASELILGAAGVDTISGGGGDDCILGGGSIDTLIGDLGTDVCIAGVGIDLMTCETEILP